MAAFKSFKISSSWDLPPTRVPVSNWPSDLCPGCPGSMAAYGHVLDPAAKNEINHWSQGLDSGTYGLRVEYSRIWYSTMSIQASSDIPSSLPTHFVLYVQVQDQAKWELMTNDWQLCKNLQVESRWQKLGSLHIKRAKWCEASVI